MMTARERLQLAYEIAFLPRRLNGLWRKWVNDPEHADADELKALDEAAILHLPIPEGKGAPIGARYRLAIYQAGASDYKMRSFIANVRARLNRPPITEKSVRPSMVRDVVLPHYGIPPICS